MCIPLITLMIVRLANRLKSLTMTQYSSDEDNEGPEAKKTERPPSSHSSEKKSFASAAAFAEVVRSSMKLKEPETPAAK